MPKVKSLEGLLAEGFKRRETSILVPEVRAWHSGHFRKLLGTTNTYVEHPDGDYIELENSESVADVSFLNDDLLLGERYGFIYSDPFVAGDLSQEPHLSLWDRKSGERLIDFAGHFGEILGWQWYDERTIFTWARDFLIRVWDIKTGKQVKALPMPQFFDGLPAINILNSRSFCGWTEKSRHSYVDHGGPSLIVTHILLSPDGTDIKECGPYFHPAPRAGASKKEPTEGTFQELQYEEYNYAEVNTLSDGRLLFCPTRYGARGCCYVWDQSKHLTLLIGRPLANSVFFYGLDERSHGVLTIKDGDKPESEWASFHLPSL